MSPTTNSKRLMAGLALALTAQTVSASTLTYPFEPLAWTEVTNDEIDPTRAFDSGCGLGDRYAFGVKRGSENKLVIEFEGGGLCYDSDSCFPAPGAGTTCGNNNLDIGTFAGNNTLLGRGVPESSTDVDEGAENLFKEWNHIFVKYCTCDLHTGDQIVEFVDYTDCEFANFGCKKKSINFRGGKNTDLVLTWVKQNYAEAFGQTEEPEKVMTSGLSAGGYGAIAHVNKIINLFPDSKHYAFSDAAAGAAPSPDASSLAAFDLWKSAEGIRDEGMAVLIRNMIRDPATWAPDSTIVALIQYTADLNPDVLIASYNAATDRTQSGFRCYVEKGAVNRCFAQFFGVSLWPTLQQEMLNNALASQDDRCNVRWLFSEGSFHATMQGPSEGPQQSWFNIDVGQEKMLHDVLEDMVNDVCVESSSAVPFFDASSTINKYCDSAAQCVSVSDRAAAMGLSVLDLKDAERKAAAAAAEAEANKVDTSAPTMTPDTGAPTMEPEEATDNSVLVAVGAAIGGGAVGAVVTALLVLRVKGGTPTSVANPSYSVHGGGVEPITPKMEL